MRTIEVKIPQTIEEWEAVSELIKRDTAMMGVKPSGSYNRCPICDTLFDKDEHFCSKCGQRVTFVDPTVIPFDAEEVTK